MLHTPTKPGALSTIMLKSGVIVYKLAQLSNAFDPARAGNRWARRRETSLMKSAPASRQVAWCRSLGGQPVLAAIRGLDAPFGVVPLPPWALPLSRYRPSAGLFGYQRCRRRSGTRSLAAVHLFER